MLKERGTKGEGEGEGRRSEKEWSVINLIKKLNARARRVVGKWIDHGLALGVLPCLASAGQKQQRKENGKWKERKKEEKERGVGGREWKEEERTETKEKKRERKGGKKKERTEIDAYVGGYLRSGTCWQWYGRRYTWTIAGNRSFIDPSHLRQPGLYFPYIYIYIYDAPRGQWSSSPEKEKGPCPFVIIIPFPLSLSPHRHDGCTIIYIASELSK